MFAIPPPRRRDTSRGGFTLIELIVVVIIIAVLAAIAGVAYNQFVSNARDKAVMANAKQINTALAARSAADDQTPIEIVALHSTGSGVTAGGTDGRALLSYLGVAVDAKTTTSPWPDASAPTALEVRTGDRYACLTLGDEVGESADTNLNPCGDGGTDSGDGGPTDEPTEEPTEDPTPQMTVPTSAPATVTVTGGDKQLVVTWDAVSPTATAPVSGYRVYLNGATTPSADVTGLTATLTGLAAGTEYTVTVIAYNDQGNAASGTTRSGTTNAPVNGGVVITLTTAVSNPEAVAVDTAGNVYVADRDRHKILKITPGGVVTTLAGTGAMGAANGTGTDASFYYPEGIAVDAAGNVYVADTWNHKIRKITPAGVVTTLAGAGGFGFADGTGTAAKFNTPEGIAVDAAGNVYVGDTGNHKIRKITPAGVVTTLAGSTAGFVDATGTAAKFNFPNGVAVDAAGNVYVADSDGHRIRVVTPAGVVTTLAGSATAGAANGTGTGAQFRVPQGVAVDAAGNVYVADTNNHRIRKITPAGVVTTLAGSSSGSVDATGTAAKFSYPRGIAVDAAGNVYVADSGNSQIRKIS